MPRKHVRAHLAKLITLCVRNELLFTVPDTCEKPTTVVLLHLPYSVGRTADFWDAVRLEIRFCVFVCHVWVAIHYTDRCHVLHGAVAEHWDIWYFLLLECALLVLSYAGCIWSGVP